ncbi:DUF89 domain-containing protein [Lactarius indigo]|nr:DUF89 domain-containing protein [Lactarius indigo]
MTFQPTRKHLFRETNWNPETSRFTAWAAETRRKRKRGQILISIDDHHSSYETVVKRWPVILTSVIDSVYSVNHELTNLPDKAAKLEEGKALIATIGRLKYEMARDRPLEPIPADGEALIEEYNEELNTWFTAPWLYAEYRLLRSFFATTQHWKTGTAVQKLAATLAELESEKDIVADDPQKLQVLVPRDGTNVSMDLSLLTNMTPEDIGHLQTIGRDAQNARKETPAWQHITTLKGARIDFLFTDLVFADFLVSHTPYVSKVVFHPKSIPWFVSDVTPPDFTALLDSSVLPRGPAPEHLERAIARWNVYLASGTFALSVARDAPIGASDEAFNFWTSPWPYWDMRVRAPGVWNALRESGLVIFKTYVRLTGDVQWPVDTSFETAVGPLAYAFPLLSLRTNKADVVVGVPRSVADALDARGEKWRVNGRYALVSFLPRGKIVD